MALVALVVLFALTVYVAASIVRSVKGNKVEKLDVKQLRTVKKRIQ